MVGTWQRLAHVELSSAGDTIDSGTFTAKENLKVTVFGIGSGTLNTNMRFNSDSTSKYSWRCERDGNGSDDTSHTQSEIAFGGGANVFIECSITNKADKEKLLEGNKMTTSSGSGAGYAPDRREQIGKWINTSDSITSIQAVNTGSGDFASGSYITVWGASDDVVSDEKDSLTNVEAGTRYEETDTRKIYRRGTTTASQSGTGENKGLGQSIAGGNSTKMGFTVATGHALIGKLATTISLYLWKDNSPTGNGSMKIYNSSGILQATSTNTVSWSGLGSSSWGTKTDFTFTGHTIVNGDRFVIEGGTTNNTNKVFVSMNTGTASNTNTVYYSDSWRTISNAMKFDVVYPDWKERGTA